MNLIIETLLGFYTIGEKGIEKKHNKKFKDRKLSLKIDIIQLQKKRFIQ